MSILTLISDTLVSPAATGNIEYNGQFFGTDSNASRAQMQRITQATAVASTSGTSIDLTGIPAWVKRVTVMLSGVSTSGASQKLFQLGTGSTTYTTSGYASNSSFIASASVGTLAYTNGFNLYNLVTAADTLSGTIVFTNFTGNTWNCTGSAANTAGTLQAFTNGTIALGAALTAVRFTTAGGADTFDAGSINILYEG